MYIKLFQVYLRKIFSDAATYISWFVCKIYLRWRHYIYIYEDDEIYVEHLEKRQCLRRFKPI